MMKNVAIQPENISFENTLTCVTAVTDPYLDLGETSIVNMVQRVSKKALLEPDDTRQQWKGEAATRFVLVGIASSRVLPTSSTDYWSPFSSCFYTRPPERSYPSGAFSCLGTDSTSNKPI
jgi:hypothetical protein